MKHRTLIWLIVVLILADTAWFTYELANVENLGWIFYTAIALFFVLVLVLARASEQN